MKRTTLLTLGFVISHFAFALSASAQSTAFTYQGRLNDGASPANGIYDLRFALYDAASGGAQQGSLRTNAATTVSGGLFTVTLDFGNQFTGSPRWLEVAVRPNGGGAFTPLVPRQPLTATPYAIMAGNVSGAIADHQLSANVARLNANQTFSGLVNFNNPANTFSGNAGALTNVAVNALVRTTTNAIIVAWGNNSAGTTTVPAGLTNVMGVACSIAHSLALKSDGTVVAWGANSDGQTSVPPGLNNVVAVAAGGYHSLALKSDGTVVAWGYYFYGQTNVPAGLNNVVVVAAGNDHNLALNRDGLVVAWGRNHFGQTTVPAGLTDVRAVACGYDHSLALKRDGTVVAWGANTYGQTTVPVGLANVVAVAGGFGHSLALKRDGTVAAWGRNGEGQTTVPVGLSNVVAVAGGGQQSLALKSDGTVVAWGNNGFAETAVPRGLNSVVALAPGPNANHVLVIRRQANSPVAWLDADNTFSGNVQVNGFISGNGGGLTDLNAASVIGTLGTAQIPNLDASKITTGTFPDARLSGNVALLNAAQTFTADKTIAPTATLSFGAQTRQMLNLWNADHGIGVQHSTTYFRSSHDFAWYRGGVHDDGLRNPGSGGTSLMCLTRLGQLGLGTVSPDFQLDAVADQSVARLTTTNSPNGAVLSLRNTSVSPTYLGAINFEDGGGGTPPDRLLP